MQLPTIPSFTQGESNLTHLQQLAAAVQFAAVASSFPLWRFYKTATQSLTASTWNSIPFAQIAIDTDGVYASSGNYAQIVTQGYYATEACMPISAGSAALDFQLCFVFTAGSSNPHYSSGTIVYYGGHGSAASTSSGIDNCECIADYCPAVCYPGDQIAVQAYVTTATSTDVLVNTSATAGWFVPQFSGRWVREGS